MHWIDLVDEPRRAHAPNGVIYSTAPRIAHGLDGYQYFIKGPDPAVVIAETLGYLLAGCVGLAVPGFALCRAPQGGEVLFASRAVPTRSGIAVLAERGRVTNPELMGECFAFDTWTANTDRNDGNFVGDVVSGGRVHLLAIDFESARILRGIDRFSINMIAARDFKPRGLAGQHCFAGSFPDPMCKEIAKMTPEAMGGIMDDVSAAIGGAFTWRDAAADFLLHRAANIRTLADEVWNA